jgi:hypothetical protein
MKKTWSQFFVYALSLGISLALNLYRPDVLNVLCTPLPIGGNERRDPSLDRYLHNSDIPPTTQEK